MCYFLVVGFFSRKGKGENLHETQRSVTKCESIWAWETNLTLIFPKKKKIIIVITLFVSLKKSFFFNNHFPKFLEIFHHFTVDSMKASITHDFGCYIQFPNSSIRIGVQVIGIFVPRKRNKTRANWNKNFKMKERGIKYSSRVVQTD